MKIFNILIGGIVFLGMYQLTSQHNLLADIESDVCCEDGDVKDYYRDEGGHSVKKIRRCSEPAHILELTAVRLSAKTDLGRTRNNELASEKGQNQNSPKSRFGE